MEDQKIIKVGNYSPSGHNASSIVDGKGISPAVMENHGTVTAVVEPQVLPHSQWKEQSLFIPEATKKGYAEVPDGGVFDASYPESATRRGRVQEGGSVSPTLTTQSESALRLNQRYRIRKLTPRECFRLMGVSEKDIDTIQGAGISNSQQYKMAGNSIVVDVLEDIFRELFRFNSIENAQ